MAVAVQRAWDSQPLVEPWQSTNLCRNAVEPGTL
jgi:hypothetical protein